MVAAETALNAQSFVAAALCKRCRIRLISCSCGSRLRFSCRSGIFGSEGLLSLTLDIVSDFYSSLSAPTQCVTSQLFVHLAPLCFQSAIFLTAENGYKKENCKLRIELCKMLHYFTCVIINKSNLNFRVRFYNKISYSAFSHQRF
jgi:hypothetical protein